jgi:FkbM family methyltransferase
VVYAADLGRGNVERRHVHELVHLETLPRATRLDGVLLYATRRWKRGVVSLRLGGIRVYVDRATLDTDWEAWRQIFFPKYGVYTSDYKDATVVDIGAHKGYFAAFALLGGARRVFSYEPERRNFTLLSRAASSFREQGRWTRRKAAVGERAGRAELMINEGSWGHSLMAAAEMPTAAEEVEVVSMTSVLEEASSAKARRIVVKIDAEGSECEIVLGTEAEDWRAVDEVFLEHHDFAPCTLDEIIDHLARAGLAEHQFRHEVVHLRRREATAASGPGVSGTRP